MNSVGLRVSLDGRESCREGTGTLTHDLELTAVHAVHREFLPMHHEAEGIGGAKECRCPDDFADRAGLHQCSTVRPRRNVAGRNHLVTWAGLHGLTVVPTPERGFHALTIPTPALAGVLNRFCSSGNVHAAAFR